MLIINIRCRVHLLAWNLGPIAQELNQDQHQAISRIPLIHQSIEDKLIWPLQIHGQYTVKSGYLAVHLPKVSVHLPHAHTSHQIESSTWKALWKINSLPKIKIFLWKSFSNALATRANLFARKLVFDPLCQFCFKAPETIEHVLLECLWVRKVWFGHQIGLRPLLHQLTTLDRWFQNLDFPPLTSVASQQNLLTHISFILWNIWKHRCYCTFNNEVPNPDLVIHQSFEGSCEYLHQNPQKLSLREDSFSPRPPPKPKWTAPLGNSIKINCDASWLSLSTAAGVAAIARNSSGQLIGGLNLNVTAPSSLFAEALAAWLGLFLAHRVRSLTENQVSFILETDSLHLFHLISNSSLLSEWAVAPLIDIIRDVSVAIPSSIWTWSSRNSNQAADLVASLTRRRMCPSDWVANPPFSLFSLLLSDVSPCI